MTRYFEIRPELKKYFGNEGTFTDPRDGNVYKTVEINGQTWLAENLRFEGVKHYTPNLQRNIRDKPKDINPDNITEFGFLYTWYSAMRACPEGWHLPTKEEFEELLNVAATEQGLNLIAKVYGGKDTLGFKALCAGGYDLEAKTCFFDNVYAFFWSATESYNGIDPAFFLSLGRYDNSFLIEDSEKNFALSVRCIKD